MYKAFQYFLDQLTKFQRNKISGMNATNGFIAKLPWLFWAQIQDLITLQICFCPKECDGKSKNRKPVEFRENILLEGKNRSKVVKFTIEPLSIEGPDMVIFDIS